MNYPRRETHFAHKTFRLMHKASVAAEIGRDAFCIVAVVLHTEDAARYRGPVRFYNSQLMETLGFAKWESFAKARQRAMDSGWLVYVGDGKRSAGQYFVTVPEGYGDICDSPIEESPPESYPANGYKQGYDEGYKDGYKQGYDQGINRDTIAGQCGIRSGDDVGELYNPIPKPKPNPEIAAVSSLSPILGQSVNEWLDYKRQARKPYKPTAIKSLVSRVAKLASQYGDDAIAGLFERSMANGWQGWDYGLENLVSKPESRVATADDLANYPNGDYE